MYYFLKYDGSNIISKRETVDRYAFVNDSILGDDKETNFLQYLIDNNIVETDEVTYNTDINYLKYEGDTVVIKSFAILPFAEQKAIAKRTLKENIQTYAPYLMLNDGVKTDMIRLRGEIKASTNTTELMSAIDELQIILNNLDDC
jgi:hypothetical protein